MAHGCLLNPPPNNTHVRCVLTQALTPVNSGSDTPLALHLEHKGLLVERVSMPERPGYFEVAAIIHDPHPPLPPSVMNWVIEKIL
jgi:hypothetical protein